jgi:hypothetical protein
MASVAKSVLLTTSMMATPLTLEASDFPKRRRKKLTHIPETVVEKLNILRIIGASSGIQR